MNAFQLLRAMNGIREEDVLLAESAYPETRRVKPRRALTLLLAAALILALGATAYAAAIGFRQRQQEAVKEKYQVEENHVESYVEYALPEEAEPGITLLSAYASGGGLSLYFTVSPVAPEDVRDLFMQETEEDGRVHYLMYTAECGGHKHFAHIFTSGDWEYWPEEEYTWVDEGGVELHDITPEGRQRRYLAQSYDAESRALTLYTGIPAAVMPEGDTLTLHIASYDCWEFPEAHSFAESGYETALHQDFGTITVEIPEADVRRLSFPEPIRFDNPDYSGSGELLGAEISAVGITWLFRIDDPKAHYELEGKLPMDVYLRQFSWSLRMDDVLGDAALRFADGSEIACPGFNSYTIDGEGVFHVGDAHWPGTIDLTKLRAVHVSGETFELPAPVSAEN